MNRYSVVPGYEQINENGEYVKYNDIKHLIEKKKKVYHYFYKAVTKRDEKKQEIVGTFYTSEMIVEYLKFRDEVEQLVIEYYKYFPEYISVENISFLGETEINEDKKE